MNKAAIFLLILLGVGLFLWMQREELAVLDSGPAGRTAAGVPGQVDEGFIIREKVKPGGYIGWHETERDAMTSSAKQTRQASHYYFVCQGRESGAKKVFLVSERIFNMERVGNVLTSRDLSSFQEVSGIEEPPLPQSFQFRRRDPK